MKYIIFSGYTPTEDAVTQAVPVIFSSEQSHLSMWILLKDQLGEPISAGFVDLLSGNISAFGESESLSLSSKPEDSELIERHLGVD